MTAPTVVFDLGNTLMSIPWEFDEEEQIAAILGFPSWEHVRAIIYRVVYSRPGQNEQAFLDRCDRAFGVENDRRVRDRVRAAWNASVENAVIAPGALETLSTLRRAGVKTVLVSNALPITYRIVRSLGFVDLLDAEVYSCDVGFLKPDPRIFAEALRRVGSTPSSALVVGDKVRTDILGGAILGMRSVLVETRARAITEDRGHYVDAVIPGVGALSSTRIFTRLLDSECLS